MATKQNLESKYRIDSEVHSKLELMNLGSPNKALRYFIEKEEAAQTVLVPMGLSEVEKLAELLSSFDPETRKAQTDFILKTGSHFEAAFVQSEENRLIIKNLFNQIQSLVSVVNQQSARIAKLDHVLNGVLQSQSTRENNLIDAYNTLQKLIQDNLLENRQHLSDAIETLYQVNSGQSTKH